ncbi:TraB domain-containing protein [Pyrococcus horikoshii]|nr:TraB/GumN family protein [Pyrococcus horikoshii]HII61809.1 TraB/GumN family protein [Pyrococcus horikoshii]
MSYLRYVRIIGTVHVSPQSVKEVRNIILRENPDAVAVELDYGRLLSLLNGSSLTFSQAIKLGKIGILAYLLQGVEMALGKQVGVLPGSEMIEAFEVARSLGIPIYMIDMPIQVTLKRLFSVPIEEKIRGIIEIFLSIVYPKVELNLEDYISLELEFKRKYPTVYKILVEERNEFMARNLMRIVDILLERKKKIKIIAVVGLGHKRGIERILSHYSPKSIY